MKQYKSGNEFLPYHASASHTPPDFRDGWNACFSEAEIRITELQAQLQQYQWQPIETAPKDGTEILVLFKRIGVKCVSWTDRQGDSDGDYAIWSVDDNKYDPYPLRGYNEGDELGWMPLPAAPAIQAEGKQA